MADTSKGAVEFLEQLRSEREELDVVIAALERRLGITSARNGEAANQEAATPKARVTVSLDSIPVGFFHNMSQADATEKLLRLNPGQPLVTTDILSAFRKSGMQLNPKNSTTILYTTLKRNPKFERVAGKAWGLSDWYPEKKRKKEKDEPDGVEDLS